MERNVAFGLENKGTISRAEIAGRTRELIGLVNLADIRYFILSAQRGFKIRDMFAGVVTLAVLGYVLNRLFLLIENRVRASHYGYTQQRS